MQCSTAKIRGGGGFKGLSNVQPKADSQIRSLTPFFIDYGFVFQTSKHPNFDSNSEAVTGTKCPTEKCLPAYVYGRFLDDKVCPLNVLVQPIICLHVKIIVKCDDMDVSAPNISLFFLKKFFLAVCPDLAWGYP